MMCPGHPGFCTPACSLLLAGPASLQASHELHDHSNRCPLFDLDDLAAMLRVCYQYRTTDTTPRSPTFFL